MSMTTLEQARLREREAEIERIRETTLRAVGNNTADGANDPALVQPKGMTLDDYLSESRAAADANPAIMGEVEATELSTEDYERRFDAISAQYGRPAAMGYTMLCLRYRRELMQYVFSSRTLAGTLGQIISDYEHPYREQTK